MSKRAPFFWYIEALNEYTNIAMRSLGDSGSTHERKVCDDGGEHDLWPCRRLEIIRMNDSKRTNNGLKYHIWIQRGPNGRIIRWRFEDQAFINGLRTRRMTSRIASIRQKHRAREAHHIID